jgi:hypothetical protein
MSLLIHKSSAKTESYRPWNRQWILIDSWRVESTASMNSRPTHQIDSKNSHGWRMELSKTLCHYWSINHHRKQNHYTPCNRYWKLSDSWRVESTASMNSRPTHQIDNKNRVMAHARNCQKRYVLTNPQNRQCKHSPLDLEIITENRVTAEVWNRLRKWIHDRDIESITNGVDSICQLK